MFGTSANPIQSLHATTRQELPRGSLRPSQGHRCKCTSRRLHSFSVRMWDFWFGCLAPGARPQKPREVCCARACFRLQYGGCCALAIELRFLARHLLCPFNGDVSHSLKRATGIAQGLRLLSWVQGWTSLPLCACRVGWSSLANLQQYRQRVDDRM